MNVKHAYFYIYIYQKCYKQIKKIYLFHRYYSTMGLTNSRQKKVFEQARRIREDLYSRVEASRRRHQEDFDAINPDLKRKILLSSAIQLADMMDNKQVTCLQIVLTFIERTINVGVKNNYVLDQMFQQAITDAVACDEQRARDKYQKKCWRPGKERYETYPPFYGVPTSLKQSLVVKDRQVYIGFVKKVNPIAHQDSLFIIMVRKMGFLPIARSNVPQALKLLETNNNIFGYCLNPWNLGRSCGGSSGGESGMVCSYSTPIGFGSDFGGSLRIPAAFTGLVTLKPHARYSRFGNAYFGKFTGGLPIKGELAPITRTVQDCILVHQFLYNPENYKDIPLQKQDPFLKYVPLNLNYVYQQKKLRIGVIRRLKYARASKPNQRALAQAIEIIKSKGHQIVELHVDKIQKLYLFLLNMTTFDQNLHIFSQFKGDEPLTVEYKLFRMVSKIPWLLRRIIMWFLAKREPRLVQMLKSSRPLTAVQVFEKIYDMERIIAPTIYKQFATKKIDAAVLPTYVTPAPRIGQTGKLQYFFTYATAWNVLFYPAGVIPVTLVRQNELDFHDEFNDTYTKNIRDALKGSVGLPVGVQVVATPNNEQKVLYLMRELEKEIKFRQKHQLPV